MAIKNIGIVETGTGDNSPRVSTLALYGSAPGEIFVLGNLPHGYTFRPTTARDRDALCNWLQSLTYTDGNDNGK